MKVKGFTLIELLVVIAIIALLSSVVLASLAKSRSKARDARRFAAVKQLMTALELYYDANSRYPNSTTCGATIPNNGWCNSWESLSAGNRWIRDNGTLNVMAPYLPSDPIDPAPQAPVLANWAVEPGVFFYFSNQLPTYNGSYIIMYKIENSPHPVELTDGVTDCVGATRDYGNDANGIITVGVNCPK
jgi:prepilin-type N-terminal cleavage/methylation domain-containing protein